VDTDKTGMARVLQESHAFDGAAFVEIFQNCIVYNEDVFADFTDRKNAASTQLHLQHGQPMLFGENDSKGIRFNPETWSLEVIDAVSSPDEVLVHDERNAAVARMLIDLRLPVALGVIYRDPAESFEAAFYAQHPTGMRRTQSVRDVIRGPSSWTVD
jgi:2-oxoglutarate ferredoxin oxidoreductase subunit beta